MKSGKVLSVILFVLLLGCIGFVVFGFIKYNDIKKENDSLKKASNEVVKTDDNDGGLKYIEMINNNNKIVKIHSIYSLGAIFSVDDNLYLIADHGGYGLKISDIASSADADLPTVGNPSTIENSNFNMKYTIYNLGVKTTDVVKTIIKHLPTHRDITSEVFIIYKDGGLSNYVINNRLIGLDEKYLTDYKIKDIKEKCSGEMCETLSYIITLQDGTTKEITNLE